MMVRAWAEISVKKVSAFVKQRTDGDPQLG
jgi:hypothetical protein